MPPVIDIDVDWTEHYAWFPKRSSWSKKTIWLKKYWVGNIYYDAMGRPPIKENSWKLIYTENEYLLYLMRKEQTKDDVPVFKSVRGRSSPRPGY